MSDDRREVTRMAVKEILGGHDPVDPETEDTMTAMINRLDLAPADLVTRVSVAAFVAKACRETYDESVEKMRAIGNIRTQIVPIHTNTAVIVHVEPDDLVTAEVVDGCGVHEMLINAYGCQYKPYVGPCYRPDAPCVGMVGRLTNWRPRKAEVCMDRAGMAGLVWVLAMTQTYGDYLYAVDGETESNRVRSRPWLMGQQECMGTILDKLTKMASVINAVMERGLLNDDGIFKPIIVDPEGGVL